MAESTALGHMGFMFGLLAVVLMLYATALALSPSPGTANAGFTWAFFAWGIGLVFVIAERLRPIRGP